MSGRTDLRARRDELLRRAESQREELAVQWRGWQKVFAGVDRGMAAAAWLRRHAPKVAVGAGIGAVILGLVRPRLAGTALVAGPLAVRFGGSLLRALGYLVTARRGRR